jgi:uncharacterized protein
MLKYITDQLKEIQLIATGSSAFELTNRINETNERCTQLLEQTFIEFRINSLQGNLRNELKRARKIYYYDNGIRNAMI